jgi:hypothetical protein
MLIKDMSHSFFHYNEQFLRNLVTNYVNYYDAMCESTYVKGTGF